MKKHLYIHSEKYRCLTEGDVKTHGYKNHLFWEKNDKKKRKISQFIQREVERAERKFRQRIRSWARSDGSEIYSRTLTTTCRSISPQGVWNEAERWKNGSKYRTESKLASSSAIYAFQATAEWWFVLQLQLIIILIVDLLIIYLLNRLVVETTFSTQRYSVYSPRGAKEPGNIHM